jgi:hypothetical protein
MFAFDVRLGWSMKFAMECFNPYPFGFPFYLAQYITTTDSYVETEYKSAVADE